MIQKSDTSLPVELYFAGKDLKDKDMFSKSDPFLKFSVQKTFYGNLQSVGRTETIKNTINPNWETKIMTDYYFEMKQSVLIEIFDEDSPQKADYLGKAETTLGAIMGAHHQTSTLDIMQANGKVAGQVIVRAEQVHESSHALMMKWKGLKIKNVDSHFNFLDKSDPYLKFLKPRADNSFFPAGSTEILMDNQDPSWKPISISTAKLFNSNDPLAFFKVECWDFEEKDKPHQFIGDAFIKVSELKNGHPPKEVELNNPKIKKPGKLLLENWQLVPTPNFVDYLKSGLQLNLMVAIDFTGSNGVANKAESLHYLGNQPTQYQQVLKAVWDIVENYDSDKKIPAFGFGAKPHFPNIKASETQHCFPINDNPNSPEVQGFDNLMNCYTLAVQNMEFSGPTYFEPLLRENFSLAKSISSAYCYQILLILTDGEIHDMVKTKDMIIANAGLPLSIIIVGIGNADFNKMQELDGDQGLFGSNKKKCPRDIVQFVPYNKYKGDSRILASELLKEIPNQVTQYFTMIGKAPQPGKPPHH